MQKVIDEGLSDAFGAVFGRFAPENLAILTPLLDQNLAILTPPPPLAKNGK